MSSTGDPRYGRSFLARRAAGMLLGPAGLELVYGTMGGEAASGPRWPTR